MALDLNGTLFHLIKEMLRDFLHIDQIKTVAEGAFNWWLSYTTSQPIQLDLAVIACLILQYVGVSHFMKKNYG